MPQKLTPVLIVEEIEPAVEFWRDRLGYEPANEVHEGDKLGFVMLNKDDVTIMYQSRESLEKDMADLAEARDGEAAVLFHQVDDIDAIGRAMEGADIVVPHRKTFYGSDEIGVREPGGHVVIFAQFGEPAA